MTKLTEEKLDELQESAIVRTKQCLLFNNKCLTVRPCGFGKNKIAATLATEYDNAVFIVPFAHNKEDIKIKYNLKNARYYTYAMLRNIYKKGLLEREFEDCNNNRTIFIFDECHFLGAVVTSKAIEELMSSINNAKFLGITATPKRTDNLDVKWHFFDGNCIDEYTYKDGIEDGIYKKPHYVNAPLDNDSVYNILKKKVNTSNISAAKKASLVEYIKKTINPSTSKTGNLDVVIGKYKKLFINKDNYYKFILFFSTHRNIHKLKSSIVESLQKAFPECKINAIIVTCENKEYKNNMNVVRKLKKRPNTVDIILNVNMLTFGNHLEDITGIMMFRRTSSAITYTQQIGRCMSVIKKNRGIIFDFMENLFIYCKGQIVINKTNKKEDDNSELQRIIEEMCIVDDETVDILKIDKLINDIMIKEKFEYGVMEAYANNLVDKEYCMYKLALQTDDDFIKVCNRYGICACMEA